MKIDYPEDLPRTMGATCFVVYYLIMCAHQAGLEPVSHRWLLDHMQQRTSPNTLTAALRWLMAQGFLTRVVHGWKLADPDAVQLPLGVEPEEENRAGSEKPKIKNRALREKPVAVVVDSAYEADSLLYNNNNNNRENRAEREILTSLNLGALRQEGIIGKKAEELAALDWITPAYIRAAVDDSRSADNPLGLAIYKMQAHAPLEVRTAESLLEEKLRRLGWTGNAPDDGEPVDESGEPPEGD